MEGPKVSNVRRSPRFQVHASSVIEQRSNAGNEKRDVNEADTTSTDMEANSVKGNGTVGIGKQPSLYLKFFETDSDGKSRSCKICSMRYPLSTAFGNLGRHLKYFHPGYGKMADAVSSLPPRPITIVSEKGDKIGGDDTGGPSPQPILAVTETVDKTSGAVHRSPLQPITTVTETADKMSNNAYTSPLQQSIPAVSKSADKIGEAISNQFITTVSKSDQSQVTHTSIVNVDNETCKSTEPKSMAEISAVTEVASKYLEFFETAPDGKSRSCTFCYQSYPIATAFGILGRHLDYYHAGYDQTGDAVSTLLPQPITIVSGTGDKMGDAISRPSPQTITTETETTVKKGGAVSRSYPPPITTVTKTTDIEPKNMTASYLKFFETAPDGRSQSCKFCNQSYPIPTAYGNLGRHLKYRHPEYDKMNDAVSSPSPQHIATVSERADKMSHAIPNPLQLPITTATEIAEKKGGAVPKPSPQPITTATEIVGKKDDVVPWSSPQPITTVPKMAHKRNVTPIKKSSTTFFEASPDGKSQNCKFCNQSYPIAAPVGNLQRHLKHLHPGEYDKMGHVVSSPSSQHIATVSASADKMVDAIPSPMQPPITTVTEIAVEKGDAISRPSQQSIIAVSKTSDEGNLTLAAKQGKMSTASFFETAPNGKSQSCKFCNQSYSVPAPIGNLQRHLKYNHPGEYDKMGDVVSNSSPEPIITALTTGTVDLDHLNWLLLRWLIGGSFPPSALQDKWLLNSFKFVNPMVRIWSNERLQAVILEVFRSMQEDVKASLEFVNSKISLTLDFWTSYEQIFYMSVTGHWIDESWSLHKVLLDISRLPYAYSGTDIYNTIVKVLKMYNIENKILSCTHDNSQKAIHACQTLKEYFDGRNSTAFFYIPCAARTLNLIIEDGLRTAEPVISKIREFVLELNMSQVIASDFKQTASIYQEGSWSFPIDISTRWSGNYAMLDIACKASKSMGAVIRKHEASLASNNMLLNLEEKVAVSITHLYLEPLHNTINNICASKVPTVGLVLYHMDAVSELIAACRGSCHAPAWLKSCAEEMAQKGMIYNDQVHNIYTYMASILDPRIKGELTPDSLKLESNVKEARDYFMRNYPTTHSPTPANGYSSQKNGDGSNRKRRRIDMATSTDELSQYLSEAPSPITTDILDWWKESSSSYPRLSAMARDFLAVQPTSVSPDELFSGKGDEVDNRRFCLPYASTQPVLCTRAWIESGFKLKYRSAEVDFEKLMEPVMRDWY